MFFDRTLIQRLAKELTIDETVFLDVMVSFPTVELLQPDVILISWIVATTTLFHSYITERTRSENISFSCSWFLFVLCQLSPGSIKVEQNVTDSSTMNLTAKDVSKQIKQKVRPLLLPFKLFICFLLCCGIYATRILTFF